jgi:replicative DNA helicase
MDKRQNYKAELEKIIISVMLNDINSVEFLSRMISSDDFTKENQELFSKLLDLWTKETDKDLITINLIKDFGAKKINDLKNVDFPPTLEYILHKNIVQHFKDVCFSLEIEKILKEKSKLLKDDFNGLETLEILIQELQDLNNSIDNLKEEKSLSQKFSEIAEIYKSRRTSNSSGFFNIRNIPSFNTATSGIVPSNLITIAGFTGQGKTFLATNMIMDLAKQNIKTGFISLEQSESEISDRLIGILTGVSSNKLRSPKKLNDSELQKISFESLSKYNLPVYVNDRPLTEIEIKSKIKYWKDRFDVKVVFLDYIGLMQSKTKFTSRERELAYYSEFLKLTAKELDVVIIILSQLNRAGKERPTIDNLAESIGLARDSDFLFTIYKPLEAGLKKDENGNQFDENNFILRCEKNRHNKIRKQILLKMEDSGELIELATEYDAQIEEIFDLNTKANRSNDKKSI